VDASCHVCFRDGFWHWELRRPDGTPCVICTIPYHSAEELEHGIEEVDALLRSVCAKFFEKRAA